MTLVPKLFGITVTGGLSSENRVFANLLAGREDRFEPLVLVHEEDGTDEDDAGRFACLADCPTVPLDTGWRPNSWAHRGNPARASVAMRYRRRIERIIDTARPFDPDVIYSSQQHYDFRAATNVARVLAVPQIVHLHYTVGPWLRRFVLQQIRTTDRVVAVSEFVRKQAIRHGLPEHRVTTIHNTVPRYTPPSAERTDALRAELGLGQGVYVFGQVARLDPTKGQLDAVSAFERVARTREEVALVLVGAGRNERRVKARVRRSPVSDRIVLTGQRSDVDDLLSLFDALVHPATQDPCPLAVLEGMAAGLPVVGYADGGVPELVESGRSGLLVGHGEVESLAEAMEALATDVAKGRELGEAAAARVARDFSPPEAAAEFADLVTSMS